MAKQAVTYAIPENYTMLKELGEGRHGHVIKCVKRDTEETVAVKILKHQHSKHRKIEEVLILEKLRCFDPDKHNIVRYHEWFLRNDRTFVVFEVLDMSVYDYMSQIKPSPMPLYGIKTIIKDVATALNALKDVGLIHTDLKLDNIMLVDQLRQPFRAKLIDFGLTIQKSEAMPGLNVQPLWKRSPEVILGLPFTEAIDIWSLGTMMAEMLLGFTLFPGRNEYDMLRFITDLLGEPPKKLLNGGINTKLFYHGHRKYLVFMHWTFKTPMEYGTETGFKPKETRKHRFSSLDELKTFNLHQHNSAEAADRSACVDLLKEMLQVNPRDRITPSKILSHPFITRSYLSPSSSSENETAAAETSQAFSSTDTAETKADDRSPMKLPPGVIMVQPAEGTTQREGASKQSSSIRNETAAAETSQAFSSTDTAETKADDRSPMKLPPGFIMVQPAEGTTQREGASKQSSSISPQAVQDKMNDCPKAKDDKALMQEPVSDCDVTYDSGVASESITGSVKTSPAVGCDIAGITSVPPNNGVEAPDSVLNQASLHTSVVGESKKKKNKKGIRGFFSNFKRKFFCCFHVPEEEDDE